ncbi:hypothetical protein D3C79_1079640 [compost metagenome]
MLQIHIDMNNLAGNTGKCNFLSLLHRDSLPGHRPRYMIVISVHSEVTPSIKMSAHVPYERGYSLVPIDAV